MAVDRDDTAADHGLSQVGVFSQCPEHRIECIRLHPSAEPLEDRVPRAGLRRPVTPWTAHPANPKHHFRKQPGIRPGAAGVTFPAKTVRGDDRPGRVGEDHADQGHLPFGSLDSLPSRFGHPQTSKGAGIQFHRYRDIKSPNAIPLTGRRKAGHYPCGQRRGAADCDEGAVAWPMV